MRVLIAEDDTATRFVLTRLTEIWGYEAVPAADGNEAWEILTSEDPPRLAILDWTMPGRDGLELCRGVRRWADASYVYTLLLTVHTEKDQVTRALEAGADDYVAKPFDVDELKLRLAAGRRATETHTSLGLRGAHDPLTGVLNRSRMIELLQKQLADATARGARMAPVSAILIDLDKFATVNETFGHFIGDVVLREVAHRVSASLRPDDAVSRFGGDEFLVMLPGCDRDSAVGIAERLRANIARAPITTSAGEILQTASFGLASAVGPGHAGAYDLVLATDAALFQAKQGGRDRVDVAVIGDARPASAESS